MWKKNRKAVYWGANRGKFTFMYFTKSPLIHLIDVCTIIWIEELIIQNQMNVQN